MIVLDLNLMDLMPLALRRCSAYSCSPQEICLW